MVEFTPNVGVKFEWVMLVVVVTSIVGVVFA